jgi:hypothetical protein
MLQTKSSRRTLVIAIRRWTWPKLQYPRSSTNTLCQMFMRYTERTHLQHMAKVASLWNDFFYHKRVFIFLAYPALAANVYHAICFLRAPACCICVRTQPCQSNFMFTIPHFIICVGFPASHVRIKSYACRVRSDIPICITFHIGWNSALRSQLSLCHEYQ